MADNEKKRSAMQAAKTVNEIMKVHPADQGPLLDVFMTYLDYTPPHRGSGNDRDSELDDSDLESDPEATNTMEPSPMDEGAQIKIKYALASMKEQA